MVVAECAWMVKPADGSDCIAVFFERLERARKLVVLARGGDLVVERVNPVGEVNERAAFGRVVSGSLCGTKWHHAFQQGQRDKGAHGAQGVTAVDKPGL